MSDDPNDILSGLGDLDWDNALDEWEKNTFVPQVARDAETNRVVGSLGPDPTHEGEPERPGALPTAPPGASSDSHLVGAAPEGTVIAPVPRELRNDAPLLSPPPRASRAPSSFGSIPPPNSKRGGLNQLFSRPKGATPSRPGLPVPSVPGVSRSAPPPAARPGSDLGSITRQVSSPLVGEERESDRTLVKASPIEPQELFPSTSPNRDDLGRQELSDTVSLADFPPDAETAEVPAATFAPSLSTNDIASLLSSQLSGLDVQARPKAPAPSAPTARTINALAPLMDDDENATVVADRGSLSDADTATRLPADDEMPTIGRASNAPGALDLPKLSDEDAAPPKSTREARVPLLAAATSHAERPLAGWLDDAKSRSFATRVVWLEEEARAVEDATARGRALLALSELSALMGDTERALAFAVEARDIAPHLPLAWRQARQLMPRDPEMLTDALDAEAASSPTPSARVHAVLLAADILRVNDRGDAAVERWESACKLDPADTRAPIARAALALAQDDHTNGCLRLAENSELVSIDKAIATALRLRGVERLGAEVDDMPVNDGLRHARLALAAGDIVAAAQSVGEIAALPEVANGALWLSAALGACHIASRRASARASKRLADDGETLARRQLAARGIELGDPELVATALTDESRFTPAERLTLLALAGTGAGQKENGSPVAADAVAQLADDATLRPLVDALSSLAPLKLVADATDPDVEADSERAIIARARLVAGDNAARGLATLGRLLAAGATTLAIDEALEAIATPRPASAGGVAIETAVRGKRWAELSEALSSLPSSADDAGATQRHVAAAIVAERAGNRERAKEAWAEAARGDVQSEGLVRIAADLDPALDLGAELLRIADEMPDGVASAVLRLEALARGDRDDEAQARVLERVHRAAPALGIGAFLAERIGRRKGDLEEVLRWIQERRSYATDPLEVALDAVREALLIADRDPDLASTRLEEARQARPDDVALRDLHERLASEPTTDRGAWREKRALATTGPAAALLWIEAALEHERVGDPDATLRAARKAAEAGDRGLSAPMIERGEFDTGEATQQTEKLIAITKSTEDEATRREALERLATLDAFAKHDTAAALLWHRAIIEGSARHKPSLRWLEHAFINEGRDEELPSIFEQIALALDGTAGGESTAHAQHAARLRARSSVDGGNTWERSHDMARLAATQPEASLWALRALNAHARARKDDEALLKTTIVLLERTQRPPERAALLLRASESASRLEQVADARAFLEQAASEDPGDVVTWGFLAEVRERAGETPMAADACESLARTSAVREHQLLAWHDAAKIWLDEVKDGDRGMSALEAAAEIDTAYADVFTRLSALYADKNLDSELARLLEKRLATIEDHDERVSLEVELARALADMGELAKAKTSLDSALEKRPDHTAALGAMADLCAKEGDWSGAEQAYVRLARLLTDPAEQRTIYERLGEIYAVHAPNLSRAELAFKEVLKRAPNDLAVLARLVDVYKRQGDVQRAVESQQEIVAASTDPNARLACLVELAQIHEVVGRDPRRSEQVLDSARKEFPTSVVALRAMAEFYARQRQMPAMQILLDRAAGDARRSFAQGRFVPSLFQVLHAAFELRGKRDAARVVAATLAAVEGQPSELMGADARAVDPRLDDLLAPEVMSPALRALLYRAGDSLDAVAPVDLRGLGATPLQPGTPIGAAVGAVATVIGLGALQILVSPTLGRAAIPLSTNPPTLLVGEELGRVENDRARVFVIVRALKMILSHASAMLRGTPQDVSGLVAGLFNAFNPSYIAQGIDPKRVADLARRIGPALPRTVDPTVGVIALEAAGMLGTQWSSIGPAASAWANRVALLAVGDPNAALDAIAWSLNEDAAPTGSEERAAWISRHAEARELMTFSVTDAYTEARTRLGLGG